MKIIRCAVVFVLAACASTGEPDNHIGDVQFVDRNGSPAGQATLFAVEGGVRIAARLPALQEMREGQQFGFHIHSVGDCRIPNFDSAGPHFNPTAKAHGRNNPNGPHLGDLPNIERTTVIVVARGVEAMGPAGLFDRDGASLVVHMHPDDLRTDPSGNSGARILCGVITPR